MTARATMYKIIANASPDSARSTPVKGKGKAKKRLCAGLRIFLFYKPFIRGTCRLSGSAMRDCLYFARKKAGMNRYCTHESPPFVSSLFLPHSDTSLHYFSLFKSLRVVTQFQKWKPFVTLGAYYPNSRIESASES